MILNEKDITQARHRYIKYTAQESYDIWVAAILLEEYFVSIGRPDDFSLALVKQPKNN